MPNEAYIDRNLAVQVLAVLARNQGHNVGAKNRNDECPILYIDLPTGQVSWHIPDKEIVAELPDYDGEMDGHDVSEKRERLQQFLEVPE